MGLRLCENVTVQFVAEETQWSPLSEHIWTTTFYLSEMDNLEAQMEEAKKRERAEAFKKVKLLCKEFGFTAGMLQGVLAKGRNRTPKT